MRLVAALAATVGCGASAQYVLSGSTADEPNLVCKASPIDSDTFYASETVPNTHEAELRFRYYANKWGEEIGQQIYYTCETYERMTPEYDASWRPGNTYISATEKRITVEKATFLPDNWDTIPTPEEKAKAQAEKKGKKGDSAKTATAETTSVEPSKSAAQLAAEEAAARRAEREAEFQAKHDEYERQLAEQQKQVEAFKKAQEEVERSKAENQAKADAAAVKFKAEQEAYADSVRRNEAQQEAAKKLMADWDARHGLKAKASTDTDANQCVTQAGTQLNASFKGNTAASIINGCGQPVDVRICLMTSTKGWNCGVGYGVGSQEKWSWSSFDATGPVFVDARISSSSRPLASPQ